MAPLSPIDTSSNSDTSSLSASESDETSDDDSVKYDTIKLRRKNPPIQTLPSLSIKAPVSPLKVDNPAVGPSANSLDKKSASPQLEKSGIDIDLLKLKERYLKQTNSDEYLNQLQKGRYKIGESFLFSLMGTI